MKLSFQNKTIFLFIVSFMVTTNMAILLDIIILRQIMGYFYLTIFPGLLLIQIFNLKIDKLEKILLAFGLSISLIYFLGLLVNNLLFSFGYQTPLSTLSILITFNTIYAILIVVAYKINDGRTYSELNFNLKTSEKAFLIIPILFPLLSVLGTRILNSNGNNVILMIMYFLIILYVVSIYTFNKYYPVKNYPITIFFISFSLILVLALRSNHIIGTDSHLEYYYFQTTLNSLHWKLLGFNALDSILSISLLPTIYQSLLNINPEFLFKIIYPLICSLSPLVIYILSKKYITEPYAFLASLFYIFQKNFMMTAANSRTNMANFFVGLLLLTLLNDNIEPLKKKLLSIVFLFSIILSHYSTTYIVFIILFATFIGTELLAKKYSLKNNISFTFLIMFLITIFMWYSQITEIAFNSGVNFVFHTFSSLVDIFLEESKASNVDALFGSGIMQKEIPHKIEFIFTWLTFALIGFGILALVKMYLKSPSDKPSFLKENFNVEYSIMSFVCVGLLFAMITIPFVSKGYGIERLYGTVGIILSTFFVIGGITTSKYLKIKPYIIILIILLPYFLCVSGVTYNMFDVPREITLNSEGEYYDIMYIHDEETSAAKWLKSSRNKNIEIISDFYGARRLVSQGGIQLSVYDRPLITDNKTTNKGYLYIRYTGVVDGKFLDENRQWHNITTYHNIFINKNKIYDNNGSEIWIDNKY